MWVAKLILYSKNFGLRKTITFKYVVFITEVLEYKASLNRRNEFACVAMCSLVMSLCSHDLLMTSLNAITIH